MKKHKGQETKCVQVDEWRVMIQSIKMMLTYHRNYLDHSSKSLYQGLCIYAYAWTLSLINRSLLAKYRLCIEILSLVGTMKQDYILTFQFCLREYSIFLVDWFNCYSLNSLSSELHRENEVIHLAAPSYYD